MKQTAMNRNALSYRLTRSGILAACVACALEAAPPAWAQATAGGSSSSPSSATSPTSTSTGIALFAGSDANAKALVAGLRTGTPITLTSRSVPGTTAGTFTFTPQTGVMGKGNVTIALELARQELLRQGVASPSPQQIAAALDGGNISVGNPPGTVQMPGVLALRSQGMGWGRVAQTIGVKLGPALAGIKSARIASTDARVAESHRINAESHEGIRSRQSGDFDVDHHVAGHGIVSAGGTVQTGLHARERGESGSLATAAGGRVQVQVPSRHVSQTGITASSRGIVTAAGIPAPVTAMTEHASLSGTVVHGHAVTTGGGGIGGTGKEAARRLH